MLVWGGALDAYDFLSIYYFRLVYAYILRQTSICYGWRQPMTFYLYRQTTSIYLYRQTTTSMPRMKTPSPEWYISSHASRV